MARTGETLAVHGYKEFMKACAQTDRQTRKQVREALRPVGDSVKADAAEFMSQFPGSSRTVAGFRTRVRQSGVAVAQSVPKVTGKHPQYGSLQMKVLARSVKTHQGATERAMEKAADQIADIFERA